MVDFDQRPKYGVAAYGRRIREIYTYNTSQGFVMYALCEDGTLWSRAPFAEDGGTGWDAVPPIPGSLQAIEEREAKAQEIADKLSGPYGRLHESDVAGEIKDTPRQCIPLPSGTAWRCIKQSYASPQCDECPLKDGDPATVAIKTYFDEVSQRMASEEIKAGQMYKGG